MKHYDSAIKKEVGDTEFESKTAIRQNPIKHVFYGLLAISRYAVSACKDM